MSTPRARIKSGKASLVGGIVVGFASFILWTAIAQDAGAATTATMLLGAVVSVGIGTWIRLADL